jgi:hypothetical protein
MIADDSMPFGPSVVVGAVVVGAVVVDVGAIVFVGSVVVVVDVGFFVDEPDARLLGLIATTKVNVSAMVQTSTRGVDGPRLLLTVPPRTRRRLDASTRRGES